MDFRCPRCLLSLRARSLPEHEAPRATRNEPRRWYRVCPGCQAKLVKRDHPALANDWLWMRFVLPGILLTGVGVFGWPPLLWIAVPGMCLGGVAAVVYTVRERLNFQVFVPLEETSAPTPPPR